MYLPSRVRSLSEVAFSDPARSMRLWIDRSVPSKNDTNGHIHQHRRLHTLVSLRLEPRTSGRHSPTKSGSGPSAGTTHASTFPAFNDEAEDGVASTTPIVPVRTSCAPVALPSLQNFFDALEGSNDFLSQRRQSNLVAGALNLDWIGCCRGRGGK